MYWLDTENNLKAYVQVKYIGFEDWGNIPPIFFGRTNLQSTEMAVLIVLTYFGSKTLFWILSNLLKFSIKGPGNTNHDIKYL